MSFIKKYPTSAMFMTFFVFSCICAYLPGVVKQIILLLSLIASIVIFILNKRKTSNDSIKPSLILMSIAVLVSAAFSLYTFDVKFKEINELDGAEDYAQISIEECEYSLSFTSCYVAKIKSSDKLPKGTKILITTEKEYLPVGSVLEGKIIYSSLSNRSNAGFDGERYYLSKNILIEAKDSELSLVGKDKTFSLNRLFKNINERLSATFLAHCNRDAGGLSSAVLLGNRDYLSDSTERDFARIGISHLLVVSGTHFAVFIMLLDFSLRKIKLKRVFRCSLNIMFILFFIALSGFSHTVMRAGIMHLIIQLAALFLKRATPLNSLAIAGVIILLINPYASIDCGLQLSFVAAYSCISYQKLRHDYITHRKNNGKNTVIKAKSSKLFSYLVEVGLLTTLITLCTLPLTWLYFGQLSIVSPLSNIIFIPLVTALMCLSVIFLLTYPITFILPITSSLLNWLSTAISAIAKTISDWKFVTVSVNYPFAVYILVAVSVLLISLPALNKKARKIVVISALALCVCFFSLISIVEVVDRNNVHITYISENKNDGFVLKSEGKVLLCDISDGSFTFAKNLLFEAENMNLTEIHSLLLTHYHNKHTQLLGRISENYILRNIILPEPINEKETGIYNSIVSFANMHQINVLTVPVDNAVVFGDSTISLYERTYISRSTHPITAVGIKVNNEDFLIMSGSFNEGDADIATRAEDAEYLIFGVHSPVYKKTFGLEFTSKPKAVIFSANAYEYMDEELRSYIESIDYIAETTKYRVVVRVFE